MKTYSPKAAEIEHDWCVVDAKGKVLGRLASEIARHLRGKHKPVYTPHADMGDHVIVVNSAEVRVTGRKRTDKVYYRHSGYVGSLKTTTFEKMQSEHPNRIIELAVRGMLPKGPLGRAMFRKLHVYAAGDHPHSAQKPVALQL